jgi:hypothetical protein
LVYFWRVLYNKCVTSQWKRSLLRRILRYPYLICSAKHPPHGARSRIEQGASDST